MSRDGLTGGANAGKTCRCRTGGQLKQLGLANRDVDDFGRQGEGGLGDNGEWVHGRRLERHLIITRERLGVPKTCFCVYTL